MRERLDGAAGALIVSVGRADGFGDGGERGIGEGGGRAGRTVTRASLGQHKNPRIWCDRGTFPAYAAPTMSGSRCTDEVSGLPDRSLRTRAEVMAVLGAAQKSSKGASGYSRWINRPLGRRLAVAAYLRGLTANHVSLVSAAFTLTGIALIATVRPSVVMSVLVAAALVIGYAFDSADGQVARLRGVGSPAGEWLDHVLDAAKISALHLAVCVSWFRFYGFRSAAPLLIPLGYAVVGAVFFFSITLADMLRRIARLSSGGTSVTTSRVNPSEHAPVLRSLAVIPNDYGVLALTFLLLAAHSVFIAVYTVLFVANTVFLGVGAARWFIELSAL